MATKYFCIDTLKFLLFENHKVAELLDYSRYNEYDLASLEMMIDSAKDTADKELFPYTSELDKNPCYFKDGQIYIHEQIGKVIKIFAEAGWNGAVFDAKDGGMQLPHSIAAAANFIFHAANNNVTGYVGLTIGAARLILSFGKQELKDTYVPKMMSGEWTGTMALTEPQAGSSLSDIVSSAKPNEEGSYDISGQKIFISAGDHQYADNIIHLMLARIEGAPAGTKGISLFVVPKKRLDEKGNLIPNDVETAGEFDKMGQRGYATTYLVFGDKNNCKGWLVGEPNKGLKYMFQMMNEARIEVGMTAAGIASAAYYASLQYAQERSQGRSLTRSGRKDVNQEQIAIIKHPDVRRMLLLQKSIVEGSLSLLIECLKLTDIAHATSGDKRQNALLLLEFLTPIAKTYPAEMGIVSVSNGLQVLGGYGFTTDFPLEQYYRDIRITPIYEGTTGIQSIDLLGRKVTMEQGKALQLLLVEIQNTITQSLEHKELEPYGKTLAKKLKTIEKVLTHLMPFALQGDYERYLLDASLFMEMSSTLVVAWQWLKIANQAQTSLSNPDRKYSEDFYKSKILTARFYYKYEVPKIESLAEAILDENILTIVQSDELIS